MTTRNIPDDADSRVAETVGRAYPQRFRRSRTATGPIGNPFQSETKTMRQQARETLAAIKTLARLEAWIRCAKAELASTPEDTLLAEFIRVNERLLVDERRKLLEAA